MIKGVTKNVIEIRSRNNGYIDKIIVFLKNTPEYLSEEEIYKQTFLMIGKEPPDFIKKSRKNLKMLICGINGAFIALLTVLIILAFV